MTNEYLEHPLNLELDSLRTSLDKYQHAAQVSSLHLQRARLEAHDTSARCRSLEAENDRLKDEVAILRTHEEPSRTSRQVAELSLALRHVSNKLSNMESNLYERTLELTHAISDKDRIQSELDLARAEIDKLRQTSNEEHSRESQLRIRCRAAEEEAKMADIVIMEYADLVRSLESRLFHFNDTTVPSDADPEGHAKDSSTPHDGRDPSVSRKGLAPVDSLTQNRAALQRLLHEFNAETTNLQSEITRLHSEIAILQMTLDAEREVSRSDREKLSEALIANERCKIDNTSAEKMVSRYMRFSQNSIDTLQRAVETQKARHAATLNTLTTSSEALSRALDSERKRAIELRDILDTLTEDISREAFGRRREVLLRMKSLAREERLVENLRGWIRRTEERLLQISESSMSSNHGPSNGESISSIAPIFEPILEEARCVLDATSHIKGETLGSPPGTVLLAEHTCATLTAELQKETERKLLLARKFASELFNSPMPDLKTPEADKRWIHDLPETNPSDDQSTREELDDHPAAPQTACNSEAVSTDGCFGGNADSDTQGPIPTVGSDHDPFLEDSSVPPSEEEKPAFNYSSKEALFIITQRYGPIQRCFRNCHISLVQLKDLIASDKLSHYNVSLLQNVVLRLDDYCEDALVELEIRLADEERMAHNFETMLHLPVTAEEGQDTTKHAEIQAFIDGTLPSVANVLALFNSKLADLEHDIVQIKKVLHEFETLPERPKTPLVKQHWQSNLSSSPTPLHSPTPTFGSIITAPRGRRVSSTSLFSLSPRGSHEVEAEDPYAHLGLRIAMPSKVSSPVSVGLPKHHPSKLPVRDTRSSSAMYLLGLGASRSGIFSNSVSLKASEEGEGSSFASEQDGSDIE